MNIIRVLGVFPYTWKTSETKNSSSTSPNNSGHNGKGFTKLTWKMSIGWKIWSGILYLISIAFIIYNLIYLKKLAAKRTGSSKTLKFAYSIYDCFLYINIVLIFAYCAKEYTLMNKILNFGEQFLEKLNIDRQCYSNMRASFLVPYIIIIGQTSTIVCLIVDERNNFENPFHLISYLTITFINGTLVATLSTLFYSIIIVMASLYNNVFSRLCFHCQNLKSTSLNKFLSDELEEEETNVIKDVVVSSDDIRSLFRKNISSERKTNTDDTKEETLSKNDIKYCMQNLLALYTYQKLVNRYFAFLLSFFMIFLISTAIISFCYVFMSDDIVTPLLYLFNTLIPVLCLINSPYTVDEKVSIY